jgi:hypothetical protein
LPIVGINVKGIDEALKALSRARRKFRAEFYYTQHNIIEILSNKLVTQGREREELVFVGPWAWAS